MACVELLAVPCVEGDAERRRQPPQQLGRRAALVQQGQPARAMRGDDEAGRAARGEAQPPPVADAELLRAVAQHDVARVPAGRDTK